MGGGVAKWTQLEAGKQNLPGPLTSYVTLGKSDLSKPLSLFVRWGSYNPPLLLPLLPPCPSPEMKQ